MGQYFTLKCINFYGIGANGLIFRPKLFILRLENCGNLMFRSEKNMQIKCGTAHRPFPTELPKNSRTLKAVLNVKEEECVIFDSFNKSEKRD